MGEELDGVVGLWGGSRLSCFVCVESLWWGVFEGRGTFDGMHVIEGFGYLQICCTVVMIHHCSKCGFTIFRF